MHAKGGGHRGSFADICTRRGKASMALDRKCSKTEFSDAVKDLESNYKGKVAQYVGGASWGKRSALGKLKETLSV